MIESVEGNAMVVRPRLEPMDTNSQGMFGDVVKKAERVKEKTVVARPRSNLTNTKGTNKCVNVNPTTVSRDP